MTGTSKVGNTEVEGGSVLAVLASSTVYLVVIGLLVLVALGLWWRQSRLEGQYAEEYQRLERRCLSKLVLLRMRFAPGQPHYLPVLVRELEVHADLLQVVLNDLVHAGYITGPWPDQQDNKFYQLT
jgi:hypothetical protein